MATSASAKAGFAVVLHGGEADGAWFEGHALKDVPDEVKVAVGGTSGPALLDLPDDPLEIGERVVTYRKRSIGHICSRGRGGSCSVYVTYEPTKGDDA